MADNRIDYNKRTFAQFKQELIDFVEQYYPETLSDFTDSTIGSLLLDLNAAVGENLSFNTDRAFQETQIDYAQQRKSLVQLAKNLGFNIPNRRPSITVVDFSITVPAKGDTFDTNYLPVLKTGAQVQGGAKTFETRENVDFSSRLSPFGNANRTIIPNYDANKIIQNYTITKSEIVYNGTTKIFKKTIRPQEAIPFLEVILPDQDVLTIENIVIMNGTNYTSNPTLDEFINPSNGEVYYEVDYLAQERIFVEDTNVSSQDGIKAAKWLKVTKRFIKEFTSNGFCKITFGGGNGDTDALALALSGEGYNNINVLETYTNNTSLGEIPRANTTIFIRYRVGGGANSNIGANLLTNMGQFDLTGIEGAPSQEQIRNTTRSISPNNPIPAFGGNDGLSNDQLRYLVKKNFSSQFRGVTINDYLALVFQMPGEFGSPYKANAFKENNKVVIPILGLDSEGKLDNQSTTILKENVAEFISDYRMINDYVEIRDGKIFNLGFDIELFIDNSLDRGEISNNVINKVSAFFNTDSNEMNEDVYIGDLYKEISDVNGVINIIDIKTFNLVGGDYSINEIEMEYSDNSTKEIQLVNNTIYSTEDSMFEIKFPEKDVRLFLKTRKQLLGA